MLPAASSATPSGCLNSGGSPGGGVPPARDRKSTRLNSSHSQISYAVFCLKKKTKTSTTYPLSAFTSTTLTAQSMMRTCTYAVPSPTTSAPSTCTTHHQRPSECTTYETTA